MGEANDRHVGVPESVRQLTQLCFLVRLVALLIAMLAQLGGVFTPADLLAMLLIGGLSLAGLLHTRWLATVRRHPMIALCDSLLVAGVVALDGSGSPLVLAALTTALLLGMWVDPRAGLITVVPLVLLYLVGLSSAPREAGTVFITVVVLPFIYLTLWGLGMVVARSSVRQRLSDELTQDAIVTAAASEERTRLARELHDSLAKTLQGLTLTAAALPTLIETQPRRAKAAAEDLQSMGVEAVAQVRSVMTGLRQSTSQLPLSVAVAHLVSVWRSGWPAPVNVTIDEVDTADEAVRFELLAILEEALDNVRRHAGLVAVSVSLTREAEQLVLVVEDRGKGAEASLVDDASRAGHHGVTGMRERMMRIGGRCLWVSVPGRGTRVECRVHVHGLVERSGLTGEEVFRHG